MRLRLLIALMLLAGAPLLAQAPLPNRYAIIICGLSGDDAHYQKLWGVGSKLYTALRDRYGYKPENIFFLFEERPKKESPVYDTSRKENIQKVFELLKSKLKPEDQLFIFVAGPADLYEGSARINLPGPDLSDKELGALVDSLPPARIITAVTTPVSGYFMKYLAKPGRITITATRSALEINETVFPYVFVDAFTDDAADVNRDGLLSVAEIYNYAQAAVEKFYKEYEVRDPKAATAEDGLIQTEHSLIDDTGAGAGSLKIDATSRDGKKAAQESFELKVGG
jgi:hypothetical protein